MFLRAAVVMKAMKHMHIGQVGVQVDFFWTTIDNESELLERFEIELLPIDIADFLKAVQARGKSKRSAYEKELKQFESLVAAESVLHLEGTMNSLAILLRHGATPLSLCHPDPKSMEHFPPWILKDLPGAALGAKDHRRFLYPSLLGHLQSLPGYYAGSL